MIKTCKTCGTDCTPTTENTIGIDVAGTWFNCSCGSTMLIRNKETSVKLKKRLK